MTRECAGRLPDFVVIGTMKSGTTTLFRQLLATGSVYNAGVKEPHFFSRDAVWRRGVAWYASLFDGAAPGQLAGEASVDYTAPSCTSTAAVRAHQTVPEARLVCLLRNPVDRMRSHYLHEVMHARERRLFPDALADDDNEYFKSSLYSQCLRPWVALFPREQLLVVRAEDLHNGVGNHWARVLEHLGLPTTPQLDVPINRSSTKVAHRRLLRMAYSRGLTRHVAHLPAPLRRLSKRTLTKSAYEGEVGTLTRSARMAVTEAALSRLRADARRLPQLLGQDDLTWVV